MLRTNNISRDGDHNEIDNNEDAVDADDADGDDAVNDDNGYCYYKIQKNKPPNDQITSVVL